VCDLFFEKDNVQTLPANAVGQQLQQCNASLPSSQSWQHYDDTSENDGKDNSNDAIVLM